MGMDATATAFSSSQAIVGCRGWSASAGPAYKDMLPPCFADRVHASRPRHNLAYAVAEVIADTPKDTSVAWFDLVRNAGWNDQPTADRQAEASPSRGA
jgi:hypothetical protein